MRAGTEIHGSEDRSILSWGSITARCENAVFGFLKDWKMAEIISLTEGLTSLLKEIEGRERKMFGPQ